VLCCSAACCQLQHCTQLIGSYVVVDYLFNWHGCAGTSLANWYTLHELANHNRVRWLSARIGRMEAWMCYVCALVSTYRCIEGCNDCRPLIRVVADVLCTRDFLQGKQCSRLYLLSMRCS
jgi:hypothetical protein